uniref:Uncharacterized protein n=1 Tax=Nicotiana tabacum TaxID=4097 RepID=A0A1S3YAY3_TOBAC|nr:PREDICTED: uncharacterized protein LOC107774208 [Nicotiana tabacum]
MREVQSDAPIELPDEEATIPESSKVQLFDNSSHRDMPERYVNTTSLDRGSTERKIEFEILEDMYFSDLFMGLETIVNLYLDTPFMENGDGILTDKMPSDETIPDVGHGNASGEVEHDEGILLVVSVPHIAFSMKFDSTCNDCLTIVMGDFKEIPEKSACRIDNTFTDQHLSNQFPFDPGESVPPSIMFESLNIHFDIPHCFPIALHSGVVGLVGGELSNEFSSCKMDVQAVQPRPPCPLPKPHFLALLLDFLAQVAHSVVITKKLNFYELVIIGVDDSNLIARLRAANFNSKTQPTEVALVAILHDSNPIARLRAANFSSKTQPAAAALTTILQEWRVSKLRSGYKVRLHVVHFAGYTFYCVIKMVELVARHRLHHGLGDALVYAICLNKCMVAGQVITELNLIMLIIFTVNLKEHGWLIAVALEKFGEQRAAKTVYLYFKVDNSSFDESDHVKKCCLSYISHASGDPY